VCFAEASVVVNKHQHNIPYTGLVEMTGCHSAAKTTVTASVATGSLQHLYSNQTPHCHQLSLAVIAPASRLRLVLTFLQPSDLTMGSAADSLLTWLDLSEIDSAQQTFPSTGP